MFLLELFIRSLQKLLRTDLLRLASFPRHCERSEAIHYFSELIAIR